MNVLGVALGTVMIEEHNCRHGHRQAAASQEGEPKKAHRYGERHDGDGDAGYLHSASCRRGRRGRCDGLPQPRCGFKAPLIDKGRVLGLSNADDDGSDRGR